MKYSNLLSPRNCDYKFLKKLLCLFQSSQKNSATRPSFFCSTYFYTYCIIRWWYIHVLSHSFHFKFLHISNCFEVMLDGFITSFRIQFSKILDMNHSKLWWTFFHMKRNNAFRRNKIAKIRRRYVLVEERQDLLMG